MENSFIGAASSLLCQWMDWYLIALALHKWSTSSSVIHIIQNIYITLPILMKGQFCLSVCLSVCLAVCLSVCLPVWSSSNLGHTRSTFIYISQRFGNWVIPWLKVCACPLTLKVLNFWKFTSYCSLKPLWSGMGEVVPARTSPTLHPPSPPTVHQLSWLAL